MTNDEACVLVDEKDKSPIVLLLSSAPPAVVDEEEGDGAVMAFETPLLVLAPAAGLELVDDDPEDEEDAADPRALVLTVATLCPWLLFRLLTPPLGPGPALTPSSPMTNGPAPPTSLALFLSSADSAQAASPPARDDDEPSSAADMDIELPPRVRLPDVTADVDLRERDQMSSSSSSCDMTTSFPDEWAMMARRLSEADEWEVTLALAGEEGASDAMCCHTSSRVEKPRLLALSSPFSAPSVTSSIVSGEGTGAVEVLSSRASTHTLARLT